MDGDFGPRETSGMAWRRGMILNNRYRLEEPLAEGGMGAVWIAEHVGLGARVAIKISMSAAQSIEQLQGEARILAKLRHRGVVRVLDVDTTAGGQAFFVMELVPGSDLACVLRESGPLDPDATVALLRGLADSLDSIHALGIVHRDVKPGNVIVGPNGEVTLIDFGLALEVSSDRAGPWSVLGTPEYMAPEQALGIGGAVRAASDRYAFAAIALEVLTGQRAYPRMPIGTLLLTLLEMRPRLPSDLGWQGRELDAVFARAMARDPDRRFGSARAFVDALELALKSARRGEMEADSTLAPTVSILPTPVAVAA